MKTALKSGETDVFRQITEIICHQETYQCKHSVLLLIDWDFYNKDESLLLSWFPFLFLIFIWNVFFTTSHRIDVTYRKITIV